MKVIKISFEKDDGSIHYTTFDRDIISILKSLPKGLALKKTGKLSELQRKYHGMLAEYSKNTNKGYTKESLQEAMKPLIMKKFLDFPHYFKTGVPEYSTKQLTLEGWEAMIENLKDVAYTLDNYIFKKV